MDAANESQLQSLSHELGLISKDSAAGDVWPERQLALCARRGVMGWFVPREYGGGDWTAGDLVRGYLAIAGACLRTAFVLTQWASGTRRIAIGVNEPMKARLLPQLARGEHFTTIAISHLTTSRRHLAAPVLQAEETEEGYILQGYSPWVTGAVRADTVVTGACLSGDRQILVVLPTATAGVSRPDPPELVALSGSLTGELRCEQVRVPREWVIHGPVRNVMSMGTGVGTGGLQTSALALGLSYSAIDFLRDEAQRRGDLAAPEQGLRAEADALRSDLLSVGDGGEACTADELRTRANSLVLRATQAALVAAKGTGFVALHPVGRWCREALFFLVWSCPQTVLSANLCEFSGLDA